LSDFQIKVKGNKKNKNKKDEPQPTITEVKKDIKEDLGDEDPYLAQMRKLGLKKKEKKEEKVEEKKEEKVDEKKEEKNESVTKAKDIKNDKKDEPKKEDSKKEDSKKEEPLDEIDMSFVLSKREALIKKHADIEEFN